MMGRATEFFDYINRKKKLSKLDIKLLYNHITLYDKNDKLNKTGKKLEKIRKKSLGLK